ncbi:MAG: hypothetical protein Q9184_003986 [Pyrenodesmia sp. 2 TL-2023]
MLPHTHLTVAVVFVCTLSYAFPGIVSERQDIGTTNFNFDTNHCKRAQDQKDLVTTELGIARDMAKAAANAALDSNNKWSKYFFDDETLQTPDTIKSYYKKLSDLYDDSSYKVKIYCPVQGDSAFSACSSGRVWASTFAFGSNKHITICPIWFDGIDENTVKEDSSVVKANCPKGAKGEKNWQQITSFKRIKCKPPACLPPTIADHGLAFTMLHEMTHLNYATNSDGVPASENKRSLDYAYDRPDCKSLRDGTRSNANLCKDFPNNVCPATKSFRNADTLAFVAAGIYWEEQCDKTIAIEPEAGVTENNDPAFNDDLDAGPDTPDEGDSEPTPSPTIGPLTSCSLVETTMTGTIAPGPQTYCTCGSVIAGINTETSGNLVYSVCAGDPYPTVATSTIADTPLPTPDLSSPACTSCTGTLGASDCSADDDQCLIEQCRNDEDCQTCGIDCESFGA